MKLFFRIACLGLLLSGTLAQDMGFDLSDALGPDPTTDPPKPKDGGDLDLSDALGGGGSYVPDGGKPYQPDSGKGGYEPDAGRGYEPDGGRYGGGRAQDPGYNPSGGDQPQEAGSGKVAGIVSAIGVALVGAASSYFAYQKKKLCFKIQGGQDPESGNRHMTQSEPQVMSNLLQS